MGVLPVAPIALKFRVPNVVVVWIACVGLPPTETETARVSVVIIGPSNVVGNAAVLGTKGFVSAGASLAGSNLTWSFTNVTKFVPGFTLMSRGMESPIFF